MTTLRKYDKLFAVVFCVYCLVSGCFAGVSVIVPVLVGFVFGG